MTLNEAIQAGSAALKSAGIDGFARDARRLASFAAGLPMDRLSLERDRPLTANQIAKFEVAIAARSSHQPIAQITGMREFYGFEFHVTRDTLDPRPDSELLVDLALAAGGKTVLDLGTGTGCLLLSVLTQLPDAHGLGVDISEKALDVARRNAERHGLTGRVSFVHGNWLDGIRDKFDLILCNPPYISEEALEGLSKEVRLWEPRSALTAGADTLAAYRQVAERLHHVMSGGAIAVFEIGSDQGQTVPDLLRGYGFTNPVLHHDINDKPRAVVVNS